MRFWGLAVVSPNQFFQQFAPHSLSKLGISVSTTSAQRRLKNTISRAV
ncbi:MAG: hypothetical protein JSR79_02915 [Proteobacteria bacterium]|nr:hypothetical protein [Pseudomonadota bacterium]